MTNGKLCCPPAGHLPLRSTIRLPRGHSFPLQTQSQAPWSGHGPSPQGTAGCGGSSRPSSKFSGPPPPRPTLRQRHRPFRFNEEAKSAVDPRTSLSLPTRTVRTVRDEQRSPDAGRKAGPRPAKARGHGQCSREADAPSGSRVRVSPVTLPLPPGERPRQRSPHPARCL